MSYDEDKYFQEHRATWSLFMRLTKYSSILVIIALILMAIFLT